MGFYQSWGYIENFNMEEFVKVFGFKREEVRATPVKRVSCFLPQDDNVLGEGAIVEVYCNSKEG